MPCCGLSEFRTKVPVRYTLAGSVVFWGSFLVAAVFGIVTAWLPLGREVLRCQGRFIAALWHESLRTPASAPSRWACRLSGRLVPLSPALAEIVYRRPELAVALVAAGAIGVAGGVALCLRLLI